MKKWNTVCSTGTKEDLQQMINNYYFSSNYVIGDEIEKNHFQVKNTKTGKIVSYLARYYRKRWQYGFYNG